MKLETLRKKLRDLQRKAERLEAKQQAALLGLPASVGLGSVEELIDALKPLAGRKLKRSPSQAPRKRRRAVITEETRAEVKKLVAAGKTGSEIAAALKISLPSVQNIKKAVGLVRARK